MLVEEATNQARSEVGIRNNTGDTRGYWYPCKIRDPITHTQQVFRHGYLSPAGDTTGYHICTGTHGCVRVPLPRPVVPAGPRPVMHACSDRTSYFNLSNMPLCQYIVILLNYLLKIHEAVVSGGTLRQGDGGDDSQEDESEWGDATLSSSGYVVCNDWGPS